MTSSTSVASLVPSPDAVHQQLDRIVHSAIFARATRSQRFLRYIVNQALADPLTPIKEYTLAIDVFDRDPSYDPAIDATVRVEAGRLRSRLHEFYAAEGSDDPVLIDIPKGAYAVIFSCRHQPPESSVQPLLAAPALADSPADSALPISRRPAFLFGLLSLAIPFLAALAWLSLHRPAVRSSTPAVSAAPVSLVILPIVNLSGDRSLDYLSDGLTENLIRQLSGIPNLRVVAHASVFRFKGRNTDPSLVARGFGATNLMTGELRRSSGRLTLSAELSSVADGHVLFSEQYLPEGTDLRLAQADLLSHIIDRLQLDVDARDPIRQRKSPTLSAEAYANALHGSAAARLGTPDSMHQAIAFYTRAANLDPGFDLAWSGLADAHLMLGSYFEAPREHMPLARQFAQRALSINPSLAEAHGTLGVVDLVYDWDHQAAEAELSRANSQQAAIGTLGCMAHLLERTGRTQNAEEVLQRLLVYDPTSSALVAELGCVDYYRHNYPAALHHYQEAMQLDPRSPLPYWGLGKSLNQLGRHREAIDILSQFKRSTGFEPPLLTSEIGYALAASGHRSEALNTIHELRSAPRSTFVDPYLASTIYLAMNDRDDAFRSLDDAYTLKSPFLISIFTEPKWEPVRSDPRFADLVQRMDPRHTATLVSNLPRRTF